MPRKSKLNKLKETILAVQDLNRNYWDMKRDNTVKGDDYFHCKANYEATSRGVTGERVAKQLLADLNEVTPTLKIKKIITKNM